MARPRKEPTVHIRVRSSVLSIMRSEYPHLSTDGDRVATILDDHIKTKAIVNKVGGFIYGKKSWNKAYLK